MIIERGSYGCVVKPSIPCKTYYQESVSKLFHKDSFFKEEKIISKMLLDVDPKNIFTLKKLDDCKVTKISKSDRTACKYKKTDFPKYQIIYEYGGIDLKKFINTDYDVKSILPAIINLSHGLVELEKHELCHRDIKESNIVFKDDNFYFIDFGMMIPYKKLYDDDQGYVLKHNYCYYPPEFKIYYNYRFLKRTDSSISNLLKFTTKDIKLNYVKTEMVFDSKLIEKTVDKFYRNDSIDLLKMAIQTQSNKVDIFSLGVVLMKVLLHSNDKHMELKLNLFKVVEKCIVLNPYKRISPTMFNKELKKYL